MLENPGTGGKRSSRNVFDASWTGEEACSKRGRSRAADSFQARFYGQFAWAWWSGWIETFAWLEIREQLPWSGWLFLSWCSGCVTGQPQGCPRWRFC